MGSLTTLSFYLGLTAFTIDAVSSGLYEQVLGMTSAEICKNHTVLNDNWRQIGSKSGDNCDSHIQEGWYRLMTTDGHSSSLPTTCVKNHVCGLAVAMWLDIQGEDLPQPGHTVPGFVCGSYPVLRVWQCCVVRETAFVHNCGNYFVYWLRPTDRCSVGYCGEGPQSDISPYTVKTGELAAEASDRFRRRLHQVIIGEITSEHSGIDGRSIRDVSTPDDLSCPEGQTRCPNSACVVSNHLCSSDESSSVSQPSTTYVTRTPITFYFSVLRDRTRPPVSLASGQPVLATHTHVERNTEGRPYNEAFSKEEDTKRMYLSGGMTPISGYMTTTATNEITTTAEKSRIRSSTLLTDSSRENERSLPTLITTSNSDHLSKTTPVSTSESQRSVVIQAYYTNQLTASMTSKSKSDLTTVTGTIADGSFLSPSAINSDYHNLDTSNRQGVDATSELLPIHTGSCSACLEPSITSLRETMEEMTNTDSLSGMASVDFKTHESISSHLMIKELISSTALTTSSSRVIPPSTSFVIEPSTSSVVQHPTSSYFFYSLTPSSADASTHESISSHLMIKELISSTALTTYSHMQYSTPKYSSNVLENSPSASASYHAPYSTSSPDTPSLQPLTISSVEPQTKRPALSSSVTHNVITSKMATVTSPSFDTTGDKCTKCIEVVFNLREAIKDKQTEQDFQVSVQTAFSRMLTRFYGRRFRRDLRNSTNPYRNNTHFSPSDVHIRNTTSMGNIIVLLLEVKHPSGHFVHNQYLEYLLQKSEARLLLEQDLSVYGATLTEFSVSDNPSTDTSRPEDEIGATSVFAQHFGLFLTVIILSSFVAFAGLIAVVYLRNKARTGMWYCPSGTRYAKQLERTLLTKTSNWRVGHMANPIPDVDIIRGEGPMTETTGEENSSTRVSCTGDITSRKSSCPEVDTWVVLLGDGMDEGVADEEYDTRL